MSANKLRIGFIGLGALGEGLCNNLVKAGYPVVVNDLNKDLAKGLLAGGATWSDDVAGTCRNADVVITVLPSPAVSRKVVEGAGGVFENLQSGGTWIEMSTTDMEDLLRLSEVAKSKGITVLECPVTGGVHLANSGEITVLVLDRPRHEHIISGVRRAGASVRLITDGDVAGVIFTAQTAQTGVDMYIGTGGAPEGVLAAGALRCVGGQMQGRLVLDTEAKRERAFKMGIKDPTKKYDMRELASGDVIVCATGVTDGALLKGVRFGKDVIETETVIYRSVTGTVRRIQAEHREMSKF
jgi:hypothetical protein